MQKRKPTIAGGTADAKSTGPVGMSERVYDILRSQIFSRQLIAGAKLNIDQIARELSVSATPVREAVNRLVAEHFAVYEPYQGYRLAPSLNREELDRLMEVRVLMEGFAARCGATAATAEQLRKMIACVDEMESLARDSGYLVFKRFDQRDNAFHELLVESAQNRFLADSYRSISVHARMARLYYADGATDVRAVVREHRAILEAYRKRDGAAAAAALSDHLGGARVRLSTMVEEFTRGTADLKSALRRNMAAADNLAGLTRRRRSSRKS